MATPNTLFERTRKTAPLKSTLCEKKTNRKGGRIMSNAIDQEIEAIRTLLVTLEPLDSKVRKSVLEYVLHRLDIKLSKPGSAGEESLLPKGPGATGVTETITEPEEIHIKDLKTEKQPRSAIEMATLVAYYLSHKAPPSDRKETITTKDIETYFKIAEFRLPTKPKFTLPNTKTAGYLDAVGDGEYKLNPVGYNLVVHSMPKKKKAPARKTKSRSSNKPTKKTSKPKK
jgi:hypothetical protein